MHQFAWQVRPPITVSGEITKIPYMGCIEVGYTELCVSDIINIPNIPVGTLDNGIS